MGVQINFSWFVEDFGRNHDSDDDEEIFFFLKQDDERAAMASLFYLVIGQLFNNSSGSRGYACILDLF